jgi:hypothetical protein
LASQRTGQTLTDYSVAAEFYRACERAHCPRKARKQALSEVACEPHLLAQEHQCFGLGEYLYTTRSEQGEEIWVVLRSGF